MSSHMIFFSYYELVKRCFWFTCKTPS